jgi:preprotein translocase subunit SecG
MEQLILIAHLLVSVVIIVLIMFQQGKGADVGASFGGGASQTLFGAAGSGNVLTRGTAWLAAAFFATSFGLAMIAKDRVTVRDDLGLPIPVQAREVPADVPSLGAPAVPALQSQDLPPLGDVPAAVATPDEVPAAPALDVEDIEE